MMSKCSDRNASPQVWGEGWERTRDGFVVEEEEHTVKDQQEVAR